MVKDPVCGMMIDPETAYATREHAGNMLYLHAQECVDEVSFGGWVGVMATAVLPQLLACGPTAGTTCVTGIVTGLVLIIGGVALFGSNTFFKLIPAERNVVRQFALIDQHSP